MELSGAAVMVIFGLPALSEVLRASKHKGASKDDKKSAKSAEAS